MYFFLLSKKKYLFFFSWERKEGWYYLNDNTIVFTLIIYIDVSELAVEEKERKNKLFRSVLQRMPLKGKRLPIRVSTKGGAQTDEVVVSGESRESCGKAVSSGERSSGISPSPPCWYTPQRQVAGREYFVDIQRSTLQWWYENRRNDLPWREESSPKWKNVPLKKGDAECGQEPVSSLVLENNDVLPISIEGEDIGSSIAQEEEVKVKRIEMHPKILLADVKLPHPGSNACLGMEVVPLGPKKSSAEQKWGDKSDAPLLQKREESEGGLSSLCSDESCSSSTSASKDGLASRSYRGDGITTHGNPSMMMPGRPNAYAIWVSEVMSQQTQMSTVTKYFVSWMKKFPTIEALSAASEMEVRGAWAGMGYYRRALYLLQGARYVRKMWESQKDPNLPKESPVKLPLTAKALQQVPGIGPYTAAAIASICYGEPTIAVDGNLVRVLSRLRGERNFNPKLPQNIKRAFQWGNELMWNGKKGPWEMSVSREDRNAFCSDPGALNQGLMEIGARICKPNGPPQCESCPLQPYCGAYASCHVFHEISSIEGNIPLKAPKTNKRVEHVVCVVHELLATEQVEEECGRNRQGKRGRLESASLSSRSSGECKPTRDSKKEEEDNDFRSSTSPLQGGHVKATGEEAGRRTECLLPGSSSFVVVRRKEHGLLGGMLEFPSLSIPASVVMQHEKEGVGCIEGDFLENGETLRCEELKGKGKKVPGRAATATQAKLFFEGNKLECKNEEKYEISKAMGSAVPKQRKRGRKEEVSACNVPGISPCTNRTAGMRGREGRDTDGKGSKSGPRLSVPSLLTSPPVAKMVCALSATSWKDHDGANDGDGVGNRVDEDRKRVGEHPPAPPPSETAFQTRLPHRDHDYHSAVDYVGAVHHIFSHIHMTVYVYRRQWRIPKHPSKERKNCRRCPKKSLPSSVQEVKITEGRDLCCYLAKVLSAFGSADGDESIKGVKNEDEESFSAATKKIKEDRFITKSEEPLAVELKEGGRDRELTNFSLSASPSYPGLQPCRTSPSSTETLVEETQARISLADEADMKSGACSRLMLKVLEKVSEFSSFSSQRTPQKVEEKDIVTIEF